MKARYSIKIINAKNLKVDERDCLMRKCTGGSTPTKVEKSVVWCLLLGLKKVVVIILIPTKCMKGRFFAGEKITHEPTLSMLIPFISCHDIPFFCLFHLKENLFHPRIFGSDYCVRYKTLYQRLVFWNWLCGL